jgi:hypothetical protein
VGTAGTAVGRVEVTIAKGRIVAIDLVADPGRIRRFDLTILDG